MTKKKVRKCELGWNCAFSGRLNGVAPKSFSPGISIERSGAIYGGVMNRNPLDRVGRANRVEKPLVLREHVSCRVLHRERNEHDRVAVDGDLESLQFAMSQIVRRCRNESVNERIRISPKLPE